MASYSGRLDAKIRSTQTPALMGIDPRWDWLPKEIRSWAESLGGSAAEQQARGYEAFSRELIDLAAPHIPAVKPQVAFFEQLGVPGMTALHSVMLHARRSGLIVIADAKRGDIGTTAEAYAEAWLAGEDPNAANWPADALTINPYLGTDSLEPFVKVAKKRNAGLYVLVRTSNPGAAEFQDRTSQGRTVYEVVADTVQRLCLETISPDSSYGLVGAVVGATWPEQLKSLRSRMPNVPLLIPGYGAQGGTSADTASAFDPSGLGAIVNSSRGINFAWQRKPYSEQFGEASWRQAVVAAILDMIRDLASHTPASALAVTP